MWVDATSAAGYISTQPEPGVATTGFAKAPSPRSQWCGWAGLGAGDSGVNQKAEQAREFVKWATSRGYVALVGSRYGWVLRRRTRQSTYDNPPTSKPRHSRAWSARRSWGPTSRDPAHSPCHTSDSVRGYSEFQAIEQKSAGDQRGLDRGRHGRTGIGIVPAETERALRQGGYLK